MLYEGQKIKFYNNDAIVLNFSDDEVLIYIDQGYIKWVDKCQLDLEQPENII